MKIKFISILFFVFTLSLSAQNYSSAIDSLINRVNEDSLISFVRILSGEDSVYINGVKSLIEQRVYNSNGLAADYLFEKLSGYNLTPAFQDYSNTGTNIIAIKEGIRHPEKYYMICAHYDAVTYYAADDNASGSATVLEAARLLKELELPYSVIFALWDEEEIGLVGSKFYAQDAALKQMDILGVINIDMIGWDGNDDGLVEIHAKNIGSSPAIANAMVKVNELYELQLDPVIENPGTSASDHSSFWNNDYGAVLLIEGYYNNDFNPYYHQATDRIDKFNVPYFHSAAQLAFGTLASLAYPYQVVGINDLSDSKNGIEMLCYPNPAKHKTTVSYSLVEESSVSISLVNTLGQRISLSKNERQTKGEHTFELSTSALPRGLYTILLSADREQVTKNLVVID
jgi:hypothetical protein